MSEQVKKPRGFAALKISNPARLAEIVKKGGKRAHELGVGHEFTSEEAREAGQRAHELGRANRFTSERAKVAGRKGGLASWKGSKGAHAPKECAKQEEPDIWPGDGLPPCPILN